MEWMVKGVCVCVCAQVCVCPQGGCVSRGCVSTGCEEGYVSRAVCQGVYVQWGEGMTRGVGIPGCVSAGGMSNGCLSRCVCV